MVKIFSCFSRMLLLLLARCVVTESVDPGLIAFNAKPVLGIHLGSSYGTVVAYFPNGTFLNIAKVDGTPSYINFVRREMNKRQPSLWNQNRHDQYGRERFVWLKKLFGIPTWTEILTEMLLPLRQAAEVALGSPLQREVSITVPGMQTWITYGTGEFIVNPAARLSGIQPSINDIRGPIYNPEVNAVLAANGHYLCLEDWCLWPEGYIDIDRSTMIYYISITNSAVYTTIIEMSCLGYNGPGYVPGNIELLSKFETGTNASAPALDKLEAFLRSKLTRLCTPKTCWPDDEYLVVFTGEAASKPGYVSVMENVVDSMRQDKQFKDGKIELLISEDPIYDAAKGTAIWARMVSGGFNCSSYDRENDRQDSWDPPEAWSGRDEL
ncbi:hypothetical protein VHEMI10154 [[Torrubiella] hemipterigena]|uniref:Uncharacterized protein n=1 Tax=[Torrubiella] hemipterigena TaxID=1531966 RepID=A0A0A1TRD8_9HYPO|nr:hypothetical protein VHEMI10154 [[Torrubiella] hemipterigena]